MKYLITENKINNVIERFIRDSFDEVINVKFVKKKVFLASEDRTIESTEIQMLLDPEGILKGNFNPNKGDWVGDNTKAKIWRTLNSMFSLKMEEYGSPWDIRFIVLSVIQ
jgi:hypothetical protein